MNRYIFRLISTITFFCLSHGVYAQTVQLITNEESRAEQNRPADMLVPKAVSMPGAPRIDVMEPDMKAELTSPLRIKIKFLAEQGAAVVPSSLKVYYGAFGIDITDRLLKHAKVENNMLVLDKAAIPAGKHRLLVKIKDDNDRVGEKSIAFVLTE